MKFNLKKIAVLTAAVAGALTLATFGHAQATHAATDYKSQLVKKGELTIGLEGTYKPFSYRKDGKLTGFEVELGKDVAKKLGVKANIVPTKWDSLVAGLGSGKFDTVLNDITPTPQRRKAYLFSTPYIFSRYALITKTGSKITSLKGVKGKTLVEGTGTDNANVAQKAGAKISWNGEFATSLQMVKQGRADATINSTPTWYAYKQDNATKGLKVTVLKNSEVQPAKVSALVNKKDVALRDQVNKAIKSLKKDGTLKRLSKKYFGTDITK